MRDLIINADDFGMSDGICRAILDLFEHQAVTNSTVMMAAEGAVERCRTFGVSAGTGFFGVHLQVNGGRPLSPAHEVPSLIDPSTGAFFRKPGAPLVPADVELEWERQIALFCEVFSGPPTHLDSHYSVHKIESLTPVYERLARKYDLPVREGIRYGLRGSAAVLKDWTGSGGDGDRLKQALQDFSSRQPEGVLELMAHPGFSDPYLEQITSWTAVRENDYRVLRQLAGQKWYDSSGFSLRRYPLSQPA